METQATEIAKLNDEFRRANPTQYILTSGVVSALPLNDVMYAVRHFNEFTEGNDPYGEHDFGSLTINGDKLFWKIDYYDQELKFGQEPLSSECRRVLTVMLASEY